MAVAKYAQRIARLPEVFELLAAHPNGLPIADLAKMLGVPTQELHEDLLAFYAADPGVLLGLSRPSVLEFLGPGGQEEEPTTALIVRIVDERPTEELGVEYVDASELALVFAAARALQEINPHDEDIAGAIAVLTETVFGEPVAQTDPRSWNQPLEPLQEAVVHHWRVRIVYSRSWLPGVTDRVIDPYLLVQTRRGWEVDAGPPDQDGKLRTFLLSNIRSFEVLNETFEPPPDLPDRLTVQRATTTVRVRVPHAARWAADMYAEKVSVVTDDEDTATLDLELLPPVEHRIGLLLLVTGLDGAVLKPSGLVAAAPKLAGELLAHHRQ